MHIHHFYPRTNNIGDHFVQRGIERLVRRAQPEATFELFDINSRGKARADYGLTHRAVERANRDANLIIVGGSNLYEGNYRWHWGVHLEPDALAKLRVPLVLLGLGSGSNFDSPLHRPSIRATNEIRLLNERAILSGVRDVITLAWLRELGVANAQLTGDPATFIFNEPFRKKRDGQILIVLPPRRFWSSKRQFWTVRSRGRGIFKSLASMADALRAEGERVTVVCNDPADLPIARSLFPSRPSDVVCPETLERYFELLADSVAVISGRLHTAVVAFSMGLPFLLLNLDQRMHGFIKTYDLEPWSLGPSSDHFNKDLLAMTARLLRDEISEPWQCLIKRRDDLHRKCLDLLQRALT